MRLSDYPTNGKSSGNVDIPFLLSIIGTIIQLAPVIFLIFCIMRPGRTRGSSSQMDSIASGPTLPARFLLLVSIACTFAFWIEPSILCRIITDYILSNPRNEVMCVVPPWCVFFMRPGTLLTNRLLTFKKQVVAKGQRIRHDNHTCAWLGKYS